MHCTSASNVIAKLRCNDSSCQQLSSPSWRSRDDANKLCHHMHTHFVSRAWAERAFLLRLCLLMMDADANAVLLLSATFGEERVRVEASEMSCQSRSHAYLAHSMATHSWCLLQTSFARVALFVLLCVAFAGLACHRAHGKPVHVCASALRPNMCILRNVCDCSPGRKASS